MGFFDQLGKKASDTMQSAKDKTSKLSAELKLKSQLADRKDRINVLYSEIGKEVYSDYQKGINENSQVVLEKLKEITETNERIEEINKEILKIKGVRICTSCGGQIPVGSDFCPKCGNKVVEVVNSAPETANTVENDENNNE